MNRNLPNSIIQLFETYGRCKIINHELPFEGYGVCAVVKTHEDTFVIVRNRFNPHIWTFPCGTVEQNESFEEACIRETWEEIGFHIEITGLHGLFHVTQKISINKNHTESYVVVFLGKVTSGIMSTQDPEILEVKQFKKLPENFAGELGKYYEDLM
jgi:8-oxo-dGTP pyrophosphatase MutT (NUDIX family)